MKAKILSITGKEKGEIELPRCFSSKIRKDILARVVEAKKTQQPYGPSPIAGRQYSAGGKIHHRRHRWKSSYGRGMSRDPRKIISRRGAQFNFVAAGVPNVVGGRRAHPPKKFSIKKINKKEMKIALESAISATADEKLIKEKYKKLKDKTIKEKL